MRGDSIKCSCISVLGNPWTAASVHPWHGIPSPPNRDGATHSPAHQAAAYENHNSHFLLGNCGSHPFCLLQGIGRGLLWSAPGHVGHGLGVSVDCSELLSHFLLQATFEPQHRAASGLPAFTSCARPASTTLPPSLATQSRMVVNLHLSIFTQSHCACTTHTHA